MKIVKVVFAIILLASCSTSDKDETDSTTQSKETLNDTTNSDSVIPKTEVIVQIDSVQTNIARYLAGLTPYDSSVIKYNTPIWQEYHNKLNEQWLKVEEMRLKSLREWGDSVLSEFINDTLPLFYPFSGPDFLHASSFYPNASDYVMIALEPVIELPYVSGFTNNQENTFLKSMDRSLRDVLSKSYFITTHMMEDLSEGKADGVLPLFYTFLARTGHDIVDVYPVELDTNGTIYRHDSLSYETNQAVQFKFVKQGEQKIKTITYFHRSISDRDLENKHPEFIKYLANLQESNTFVKAASYLMHYAGFGYVRDACMNKSDCIFQDDTGVPLRYLEDGQWDIQLFGAYTRPIKNFTAQMYQTDLKELYEKTEANKIKHIPFSLGYHIVGDKIQNHQIFKRK